MLYSLLSLELQSKNAAISAAVFSVIKECLDIAMSSIALQVEGHVVEIEGPQQNDPNIEVNETGKLYSGSDSDSLGVYFPHRPIVRNVKSVKFGSGIESQCNKQYQSNTLLGSGIILFWCAKHRMCLGWVFLKSSESLEIVYTTILTRFPKVPRVICYDNACNLAEYCYNRAPK